MHSMVLPLLLNFMKKKDYSNLSKILAVIALITIMLGGYILNRRKSHVNEATKLPYYNVTLEQVPDGTFSARTKTSFLHIELTVTVQDHQIKDIKIIESEGIDSQTAKPILEKIKQENKTAVQAIKGAELGSLVYISCVDSALYKAIN